VDAADVARTSVFKHTRALYRYAKATRSVYQEFTDFDAPKPPNKDIVIFVERKTDKSWLAVKSSKSSADPFFYAELALSTYVLLLFFFFEALPLDLPTTQILQAR
jgi:hypothetical protein